MNRVNKITRLHFLGLALLASGCGGDGEDRLEIIAGDAAPLTIPTELAELTQNTDEIRAWITAGTLMGDEEIQSPIVLERTLRSAIDSIDGISGASDYVWIAPGREDIETVTAIQWCFEFTTDELVLLEDDNGDEDVSDCASSSEDTLLGFQSIGDGPQTGLRMLEINAALETTVDAIEITPSGADGDVDSTVPLEISISPLILIGQGSEGVSRRVEVSVDVDGTVVTDSSLYVLGVSGITIPADSGVLTPGGTLNIIATCPDDSYCSGVSQTEIFTVAVNAPAVSGPTICSEDGQVVGENPTFGSPLVIRICDQPDGSDTDTFQVGLFDSMSESLRIYEAKYQDFDMDMIIIEDFEKPSDTKDEEPYTLVVSINSVEILRLTLPTIAEE